jgi:hypothetical protein
MATLTGAGASAVAHDSFGIPANCAAVMGISGLAAAAPSGGLSGGLTLINVANGMDFTLDATALAELSRGAFFRVASDPYPDFAATEIDPVSSVVTGSILYRSVWARPIDAVSAVLMRSSFMGEYVLDDATASNTDFVATFPTRSFYVSHTAAAPPFSSPANWAPTCGAGADERVAVVLFDREEQGRALSDETGFDNGFGGPNTFCAASVVFGAANDHPHFSFTGGTPVLGSFTGGYGKRFLEVSSGTQHGWMSTSFSSPGATTGLTSLPTSTRIDLATGIQAKGAHTYKGLPVTGFMARTFVNGTLQCGAGACQGNYGGAFPFRYLRTVTPATVP